MRRLQAIGGQVVVSVLDLAEHEETVTTPTGDVHVRYVIDLSTGLAMAADQVHVPAGVIISAGHRVPHAYLQPGTRIVIQRDLGRAWTHEGMTCQAIQTMTTCPSCGADVPSDSVPATIAVSAGTRTVAEGTRTYHAVGARVLVQPLDLPPPSDTIEVVGSVDDGSVAWGRVISTGEDADVSLIGAVVCWRRGAPGAYEWQDGQEQYVSVRTMRQCPGCGHVVHGGDVLAVREEAESAPLKTCSAPA